MGKGRAVVGKGRAVSVRVVTGKDRAVGVASVGLLGKDRAVRVEQG